MDAPTEQMACVCFSRRLVRWGETRLRTSLRQLSGLLHLQLQQRIQAERRQEDLLKLVPRHTHTHTQINTVLHNTEPHVK